MNAYECSNSFALAHGLAALLSMLLPSGCDPTEAPATASRLETSLRYAGAPFSQRGVSLGDGTTCAVTPAGNVKCWGIGDHGQLGQGHRLTLGDDEPLETFGVVELGDHVITEVHTNGAQTFALLDDGTVRAWGANSSFELGLMHAMTLGDDETLATTSVATMPQLGGTVVQLAVGGDFACARLDGGGVRCFGAGDFGQLGQGHTMPIGDDEAPASIPFVDLGAPAIDVTAGAHHACAALEGGSVRCWGLGLDGRLGLADTETIGDDERPSAVPTVALGAAAVRVVAGGHHTCAVLETGAVRCWGWADEGQLGLGDIEAIGDDEAPTAVDPVDLGGAVVGLAAGNAHTCALREDGRVLCWGSGADGRLGLGHTETIGDDEAPSTAGAVDLGERDAMAIFAGPLSTSTCVVVTDGSLRCWGENDVGQLGHGHTLDVLEGGGDVPDIVIDDDDDA